MAKKKEKEGDRWEAKSIHKDVLAKFSKHRRARDGLNAPSGGLVRTTSKFQDPPQDQLQALMNLYNQGQLQQALAQAESLVGQFPTSAILFNVQGAILKGLGQLLSSVEAYKKSIAIKPDYADAYSNMGLTLTHQGNLDGATEAYKKALVIKPNYPEAFNNLGFALRKQGKLDEAADAFKQALAIKPNYPEASHMASSLTGKTTNTAPREYVENLFDGYATKFDQSLVGNLEYGIPEAVRQLAVQKHGSGSLGSILDLGCGTGLTGVKIREFCSNLEGIDLSSKMLELARTKKVYDKLDHVDIVQYLSKAELDFDYFISTDVFIYVGELSEVFSLIKARNKKPGKLIFSTEHTEKEGFHLEKSGRYSHSLSYIEKLCKKFNFSISHFSQTNLRKEKGSFLIGGLYLLDF